MKQKARFRNKYLHVLETLSDRLGQIFICKPLRFLIGSFAKSRCLQIEGLLANQRENSKFASREDRE